MSDGFTGAFSYLAVPDCSFSSSASLVALGAVTLLASAEPVIAKLALLFHFVEPSANPSLGDLAGASGFIDLASPESQTYLEH